MATTMQDVIRRIQIQASQEGVEQTTAALQKLAGAQDVVAVATSNTERATVSVQGKLTSLMKTLDAEYASEQKLAAVEKTLAAARSEGLISIQRENELLSAAAVKYSEAGEAAKVMGERMETAKELAKGLLTGLGAGIVLGGLAELPAKITEAVEAGAKLAGTAQTIGLTADNLQRLDYAARLSDVSTLTMNDALEKFSKNLGIAATGAGTLANILKENHVAISGDVTKDFENFANLVQGATNAEQKNYLVTAAFGKGAADMGRLFNGGAEGVKHLAEEADGAGAILSENTLKAAEDLNREFIAMQATLDTAFEGFMVNIAPPLEAALAAITAAVQAANAAVTAGRWAIEQALPATDRSTEHLTEDLESQKALLAKLSAGGGQSLVKNSAGQFVANPNFNPMRVSTGPDQTAAVQAAIAADQGELSQRTAASVSGWADTHGNAGWGDLPKPTTTPPASTPGGPDAYKKLIASAEAATASLKAQEQALTETAGQAAFLTEKQNLLNKANSDGLKLSPTQLKEIDTQAKAYANEKLQLTGLQETMADQSPWDTMEQSIAKQNELLKAGAINWSTYATEVGKSAETMVDSYGNAANDVIGNLSNLTDAMGLQGKAAFEIQKDLSIARAVVAGGEAIVHSYNAGAAIGGPPVGFAFAAIATTAVAAQIAAIASTSYQSTSPASSSGGSSSSTPTAAAAPVQAGPTVNVQFLGSANTRYSRDEVLTLIDAINSATNNGAKLNVV